MPPDEPRVDDGRDREDQRHSGGALDLAGEAGVGRKGDAAARGERRDDEHRGRRVGHAKDEDERHAAGRRVREVGRVESAHVALEACQGQPLTTNGTEITT